MKTNLTTTNSDCPSDGVCTFEVLKNKSFEIKRDGIGAWYPSLTEGKSNIIKFEYKRNEIANTQDGQYSELIYMELPGKLANTQLRNGDLSTVKLLFARLCFCRGQTGYYKVSDGLLEISENKDGIFNFKLNFKVDEVPQVITLIEASFSL